MNEKSKARSLMYANLDKIIIDFECPHDGPKHKHHEDYGKPFNVQLLCTMCHGRASATLKARIHCGVKLNVISNNLRSMMAEANVTETELSEAIGKKFQFISHLLRLPENKSITVKTLTVLMNFFNKNASDFLSNGKIADAFGKKTDDFFVDT